MNKNTRLNTDINSIILDLLGKSLLNKDYSSNLVSLCNKDIWQDVFIEAAYHNVETLILKSIMNLPQDIQPDNDLMGKWRTTTILRALLNESLIKDQTDILNYFAEAGIDSVILKGTSVACFYPSPELRSLGDIDILVKKSDCELATIVLYDNGYIFDHEHDFHIVVRKSNTVVELHTEVSRFPDNEVGKILSNALENVFMNSYQLGVNQVNFPAPSPFDNALILLLHMQRHLNKGIGLRQLCDWLMFVNSNSQQELWDKLLPFLNKTGLKNFTVALTKIGVLYLGLDSKLFSWCLEADNRTCDLLLQEILSSGNMGRKRSDEEKASGYLTDGFEKTDGNTYSMMDNMKRVFFSFSHSAKRDFPFLKKYPILLPIMCLYIPLRYFVRMIMGKRPELATGKLFKDIERKRNLYKELKIFQTKS